jgi:cadmium resistance protein CadD (predicted permease)
VAFPMIYAVTYVSSGRDNIYLIIFYNINSSLKRYLSYLVVFLECIQIVLILEII